MPGKRKLVSYDVDDDDDGHDGHDDKPPRHLDAVAVSKPSAHAQAKRRRRSVHLDNTAGLSDELLIRIFSFLDEKTLLAISPVSRRFHRITSDSQLWRPHYYLRFILPRAHRIPGFRAGATRTSSKLRYSAGRFIWADGGWGRRSGFVGAHQHQLQLQHQDESVDWKKQYRLRHNWARGRCAVDEMPVRQADRLGPDALVSVAEWQTLVKVVDGLAVTVDATSGLRAWHLKTRRLVAQTPLSRPDDAGRQPTCLAVDDVLLTSLRVLDIAVGFDDGHFGTWRLDVPSATIRLGHRHATGCCGELLAIAYAHPYLAAASRRGFISLFSLDAAPVAAATPASDAGTTSTPGQDPEPPPPPDPSRDDEDDDDGKQHKQDTAPATPSRPRLLTRLQSHSTRPPLALSIRRTAVSVVASIAYTFDALGGWSIGIQDLDVSTPGRSPHTVTSRVASTLPTPTPTRSSPVPVPVPVPVPDGPIRLCYSHPYLLATLPDNTLVLHLCTSTATSLSISPGLRLWGHTSGISDAEITPRGKAVSLAAHGHEIRVWELEGRVGGPSVEIRPAPPWAAFDARDRGGWVGFDDEMVVVLRGRDGRESLVVYDFA
ncbi:hypothetical protein E4U42_005140 [Claviceps africana]|uniref:F-box domain-containing protein n=1 Tax=Claviceps africana TaxID=83212 RepID=A0A8K0J6Y7_9HYPO|nr:hypothetical protein E4U42_005140 [Claviceps africana]